MEPLADDGTEPSSERSEDVRNHRSGDGGPPSAWLWFSGARLSRVARREFALRDIPFCREDRIPIHYKGRLLESHYSADFICFDSIVVELKALARLSGTEEAQVINYLKATGCKIGLLLNFGTRSLEHRRFVF